MENEKARVPACYLTGGSTKVAGRRANGKVEDRC